MSELKRFQARHHMLYALWEKLVASRNILAHYEALGGTLGPEQKASLRWYSDKLDEIELKIEETWKAEHAAGE